MSKTLCLLGCIKQPSKQNLFVLFSYIIPTNNLCLQCIQNNMRKIEFVLPGVPGKLNFCFPEYREIRSPGMSYTNCAAFLYISHIYAQIRFELKQKYSIVQRAWALLSPQLYILEKPSLHVQSRVFRNNLFDFHQ